MRIGRDDRARGGGHHARRTDARAHREGVRVEPAELRDDAREHRHPEGAEDRAADVHAHDAAAFGRVHAELFTDDGDVGFAVDRVAGADRWQTEDERAEEVAEFLHDEGETRIEEHREVRTDVETDLGDEHEHRDRHEVRGALHLGGVQDAEPRPGDDAAQNEGVEERQQDDESELLHADPLGHADDENGQKVQLPVFDEVHERAPLRGAEPVTVDAHGGYRYNAARKTVRRRQTGSINGKEGWRGAVRESGMTAKGPARSDQEREDVEEEREEEVRTAESAANGRTLRKGIARAGRARSRRLLCCMA